MITVTNNKSKVTSYLTNVFFKGIESKVKEICQKHKMIYRVIKKSYSNDIDLYFFDKNCGVEYEKVSYERMNNFLNELMENTPLYFATAYDYLKEGRIFDDVYKRRGQLKIYGDLIYQGQPNECFVYAHTYRYVSGFENEVDLDEELTKIVGRELGDKYSVKLKVGKCQSDSNRPEYKAIVVYGGLKREPIDQVEVLTSAWLTDKDELYLTRRNGGIIEIKNYK